MAHNTAPRSSFFSFLLLFFFIVPGFCTGFFSLSLLFISSLWAFWCTSFYHYPDFLRSLSAISRAYPRFSRFFRIACFAWHSCYCIVDIIYLLFLSHSASSLFCSVQDFLFLLVSFRFVSPLLSHHCPCSYTCARYDTSSSPLSVSVSLISLCFPFFPYDQPHYHGSTI